MFGKKSPFEINFLLVNQLIWTVTSIFNIPLVLYQILLWLPAGLKQRFWYLFRWFSLTGPFYLLSKIPETGLSFVSIFGVLSGIISAIIIFIAWKTLKIKISLLNLLIVFFYYPYTLILNFAALLSLFIYGLEFKETYFID